MLPSCGYKDIHETGGFPENMRICIYAYKLHKKLISLILVSKINANLTIISISNSSINPFQRLVFYLVFHKIIQ